MRNDPDKERQRTDTEHGSEPVQWPRDKKEEPSRENRDVETERQGDSDSKLPIR
jgi:hypothetical protein